MKIINTTDKNNKPVYVGDEFWAYIMTPTLSMPTKVRVVEDISPENLNVDSDNDVEDYEGERLWNSYMIIKYGDRVENGVSREEYHLKNIARWNKEYDFKTRKFFK